MTDMGGEKGAAPLLVLTCIRKSTSVMMMVVVLARAISSPAAFRDDAPDDGEAATMMPLVSLLPSGLIGPIFLLVGSPSCQIAHAQLTLFLSLFQSQPTKNKLFNSVSTTSSFQLPIEDGRLPVTKLPRHKQNSRTE